MLPNKSEGIAIGKPVAVAPGDCPDSTKLNRDTSVDRRAGVLYADVSG